MMRSQQGYLILVAVFFIMVIGVMGNLIAYMFAARAPISAAQYSGYSAFYMAESGLEIATRILNQPTISSRIACAGLTGNAQLTDASFGSGTISVIASGGAPVSAYTSLSASLTSSATTVSVANASGFAASGRLVVDREILSYTSIVGNTFINVTRGIAGSLPSAHPSTAIVSQYQCSIDSSAGIPSVVSPTSQRAVQWNVQLQDVWVAANHQGNKIQHLNWNQLTELAWGSSSISANKNTRANLNAISMLSNADGWSVGDEANNNFTLTHWNGSAWSLVNVGGACDAQNLYGVSMVANNEGWAVGARYEDGCGGGGGPPGGGGDGPKVYRYTIMYWNGAGWSLLVPTTSPSIPADATTNQDLNAVHVIDTNADGVGDIGFAVGNNGVILQYAGGSWSSVTSPTNENLKGVYVVSSSEAWAVGENGVIIVWNGAGWSNVSSPTGSNLNAIAMQDSSGNGNANFGLTVGDGGAIIAYNGSTWSTASSGSNKDLNGVGIQSSVDAWAVGINGTALHWNGNAWISIDTSSGLSMNGVSVISTGNSPVSVWSEIFR